MRQLVYVSAAARVLSAEDLEQILYASRHNNPASDVTGMLLHIDSGFLQILEGPEEGVEEIYRRIAQDRRHKSLSVLSDQSVQERLFSEWSMGFDRPEPEAEADESVFAITRDAIGGKLPDEKAPILARLIANFYTVNNPAAAYVPRQN